MQVYFDALEKCCSDTKAPFLKRFRKESGSLAQDVCDEAVYNEFLKFLIFNAVSIGDTGRSAAASPLIERMWRQAVLYSKQYIAICKILQPLSKVDFFGRTDPTEYGDDVLNRYNLLFSTEIKCKEAGEQIQLAQVTAIWPRFDSHDEYRLAYSSVCWFAGVDLDRAINRLVDFGKPGALRDALHSYESAVTALIAANSDYFLPDRDGTPEVTVMRPNFDETVLTECQSNFTLERLKRLFTLLFEEAVLTGDENDDPFAFKRLCKQLQREQLVDEQVAIQCVNEYKRFLVLAAVNRFAVSPSAFVDEAWHAHQNSFGDAYKRCCLVLFNRYLNHCPALAAEDEHGFENQFVRTVELYKLVFENEPRSTFWPVGNNDHSHSDCIGECKLTKKWVNMRLFFADLSMTPGGDDSDFSNSLFDQELLDHLF